LKEYENWENTKSQYELKEIASEMYVYTMKITEKTTTTKHCLCQICFDINHYKSVLQCQGSFDGYKTYECFQCKNKIHVPDPNSNESPYVGINTY
jgi:hypothetical protein